MTLKSRIILSVIIGIVIFGLAILIWAEKTGKITILGAENAKRIAVQIKNLTDWNKGQFSNASMENGTLKLKNTTTQTTPSSSPSSSPSASPSTSPSASPSAERKTINNTATEMVLKTSSRGNCTGLAPSDWAIVSSEYGLDAGLSDPKLTTFASWSVPWSLKSMLTYFGHPELAEEENFLKAALCTSNFADRYGIASLENCGNGGDYKKVSLGAATSKPGGYYMREYSLTNNAMKKDLKGQLIYKNFSSGDILLYLMRMGSTVTSDWASKGSLAVSSAVSIRCAVNTTGVSSGGTGINRKANDPEITLSDKWQEAIMGYENVYNPATGQHWTAPTSSRWETGPQGPGYYLQNGNDLTLLSSGFGT